MRTISEGIFRSRCCASVTPPNPPPTIITLCSLTVRPSVSTGSVVFAQSFFEFGLRRAITKQRLLKLVIGFSKRGLRLQHIRQERCRQLVPVRIDAQGLAGRFLPELSDNQSLASLLQLSEFVAYMDEYEALRLM